MDSRLSFLTELTSRTLPLLTGQDLDFPPLHPSLEKFLDKQTSAEPVPEGSDKPPVNRVAGTKRPWMEYLNAARTFEKTISALAANGLTDSDLESFKSHVTSVESANSPPPIPPPQPDETSDAGAVAVTGAGGEAIVLGPYHSVFDEPVVVKRVKVPMDEAVAGLMKYGPTQPVQTPHLSEWMKGCLARANVTTAGTAPKPQPIVTPMHTAMGFQPQPQMMSARPTQMAPTTQTAPMTPQTDVASWLSTVNVNLNAGPPPS